MNRTSIYKSAEGERKIKELNDMVSGYWPVPCDKLNISTRHGNTFIIASGEVKSPPLILLHGAGASAVSWMGDIVEYSRRFRVYAVDIPGEAGKSDPVRLPWNGPGYGEWLEDVLNGLNIAKASLVGLSLGGWMSLKLATYRPERVEKLVLLATGGIIPARASFLLRCIWFSLFGEWGANKINRLVFGKQPVSEEAMRFFKVILDNFKPRMDKQPMFTDQELAGLSMPVLLIAGLQDVIFPSQKIADRMRRLVPQVEVKILPDQGHALLGLTGMTVPFLMKKIKLA